MSLLALRRCLIAALAAVTLAAPAKAAPTIETAAKFALLLDFDTGTVLLEKNADDLMAPSSMSKLMTVYMAFDALKAGRVKPDDMLLVSEKAWRMQGSKMFVHVGDRVKIEDLLKGIIIQSGNDACIVVAEGLAGSEEAFAEQETKKARELGLTKSTFRNASGWPADGHMMTARDLAVLAKRIIIDFPEYYPIFSIRTFTYNGINQGNRNPLLYKDLGADGLKTGHTEGAGYSLTGSAKRDGRRLILVVNGLTSIKQRGEETERLFDWGFREFSNYLLFDANQHVADAETWLGSSETVPLVAGKRLLATLPRNARDEMVVKVVYNGPIAAPIRKGDPIAKLMIDVPGQPPQELPLLAGADVEKLGFFGKIGAAVKYLAGGGPKAAKAGG
jgi:D-alanyl-D-alanine carboxypeptidase (penicillin-binding protein 5/6)